MTHYVVECRVILSARMVSKVPSVFLTTLVLCSAESSTSEGKDKLLRLTRDHLLGGLSDDAESNR